MTTLALIVAMAAVSLGLATLTRLPPAPLAVLAGLGLRAVGAPLDERLTREGLLLSVTFLVFVVGAEIDRRHIAPFRRLAIIGAALQLLAVVVIAIPLAVLLELEPLSAAYLALALGAGSTFVVLEILRRRERFFEPVGRLVVGVALHQDALVIAALVVLVAAVEGAAATEPPLAALAALGVLVALAAAAWLCSRFVAPFALLRLRLDVEERLLFVLAVLFAFVGAAYFAGLPLAAGAFFAGYALSRFPVSGLVRGHVSSFSDFFVVVFYVMLGSLILVPAVSELIAEIVFVAAFFLLRPLVLLPLARRAGLSVRASFESVTLLAPAGELALVVALVAAGWGHIDEGLVGVIAMVVVLSLILTPAISSDRVTRLLTRWYPSAAPRRDEPPRGHVLLIGAGQGGAALIDRLRAREIPVVVVDDDPGIVGQLASEGIRAIRGEGGDPEVLTAAGIGEAVAVVSTMRRLADNAALLACCEGRPVLVRVFSEEEAEAIRSRGGRPIVEAALAEEAFFGFYERLDARDRG